MRKKMFTRAFIDSYEHPKKLSFELIEVDDAVTSWADEDSDEDGYNKECCAEEFLSKLLQALAETLPVVPILMQKKRRPRLQGKPVGMSAQARFVNSLSSKDKKLACMFGIIKNNTAEHKRARFLAAKAEREHQEALEAEIKNRRGVPTKEGFYISIKKMDGTYSIIEITAEQALSMDGVIAVGESAMKWLELNK